MNTSEISKISIMVMEVKMISYLNRVKATSTISKTLHCNYMHSFN